jgi:hypothetical protein
MTKFLIVLGVAMIAVGVALLVLDYLMFGSIF